MTQRDADADAAFIDRLYAGEDLDGLQQVRGLVARVRAEMPGVEPAPAISAMLLQAARPARTGFWARLRTWFGSIAMHPGLAAAATLVIVVGAAAIWMRQGGKAATPTVSSTPPPGSTGADQSPALEDQRELRDEVAPVEDKQAEELAPEPPVRKPPPRKAPPTHAAGSGSGSAATGDAPFGDVVTESAPPLVTTKVGKTDKPPPPPPSDDPQAPRPADDEGAPSSADQARELTRQATLAAKKHDCATVASLATQVKALDPAYYATDFVPQADIAACTPVAR